MNDNQLFQNFYNREDIEIQIQQHELEIRRLKSILSEMDRMNANVSQAKITKEMVMDFFRSNPDSNFLTTTIVDTYFPGLSEDERGRHVRIVSVYLAGLVSDGFVTARKLPGIKGNLYKWNK